MGRSLDVSVHLCNVSARCIELVLAQQPLSAENVRIDHNGALVVDGFAGTLAEGAVLYRTGACAPRSVPSLPPRENAARASRRC